MPIRKTVRKLVKKRLSAAALGTSLSIALLTCSVVLAAPFETRVIGVPASTCKAEGAWVGGDYVRGQPELAGDAAEDQFTLHNSAAWHGGEGTLFCTDFEAPDDRMSKPALSFSLAIRPSNNEATTTTTKLEQTSTKSFQLAKRAMLQQPLAENTTPTLDSLLRVLVSPDNGHSWRQLHVFTSSSLSNTLAGGYTSVSLPPEFITVMDKLQVKVEALQAGNNNSHEAYVDSLFLTYQRAPSLELVVEAQNPSSVSDGTPVFAQNNTPSFRLEPTTGGQRLIDGVAASVSDVLGVAAEPELDVDVTLTDSNDKKIDGVDPRISWEGNAWQISAEQPASMKPGAYKLAVKTLDSEGNAQTVEQDFLWGVLALNMHKSIYQAEDTVRFDMAVLDQKGTMVCDSELTVEVSGPSKATFSTKDGSVIINDDCSKLAVTEKPDYEASWQIPKKVLNQHNGQYNVMVTAKTANGTFSISDSFKVGAPEPVLIERRSHTRIMPKYSYVNSFDVTPINDFEGTITETVPVSFSLSDYSSVKDNTAQKPVDAKAQIAHGQTADTQQLAWRVKLEAGHTYSFSYTYNAPDISPEFYLLGPLTLEGGNSSFAEPRQWQIASDAVPTAVQRYTQHMLGNTTADITLATAVDTSHSFIIVQSRSSSDVTATSTKIAASFINDGATVRLQRDGSASSVSVEVQVVTHPSITVEHGTINVSTTSTATVNQSIADVGNTNKAFAIITNRGTGTAANYMRQQWAASLTSSTNLNITRSVTGNTSVVNYQIVQFTGTTTVEHDTITIGSGASSGTAAISAVTIEDSFIWGSWRSDTAQAVVAPSWEFDSTTQISATRASTTGTTIVELMTVSLPSSAITQRSSIADIASPTNATVTAVADTAKTFTFVSSRNNTASTTFDRILSTTLLTSTTNVETRVGDLTGTSVGRVQTIELPIVIIPDTPILHASDGTNQIAFNDIRQNSTTPTFRASATNTTNFDRFQLELNTAADFTGTSYTQTFTGTYTSGTQYNLTANSLSPSLPTTDGATYYGRVRASADSGVLWSDWTSGTWSYTYKSSGDPDWFQTTDAQFNTGTLSDTATSGSGSVELGGSGAIATTGTVGVVTSSAQSSSSSVTVPSDATFVVLVVSGYMGPNFHFNGSVSLGGNAMTIATRADSVGGTNATAMFYLANPSTGSQTLAWSWDNAPAEGVIFMLRYLKGVDLADPFRSTGGQQTDTGTSTTGSMTAQTGDYAIAGMDGFLSGGGSYDVTWTGATEISETHFNSNMGAMAEASPTGNITITANTANSGGIVGAVLKSGAITSGTITSSPTDYDNVPGAGSWGEFTWAEDETNGSITAQLYYTNSTTCDTVIPNAALTGNESGFASGPVDISGLNTTTYNEICVRATLTDSGGTPFLNDWTVTWAASNIAPDDPTTLVQRKIDNTTIATGGWTNEATVEFTAQAIDDDTTSQDLRLCVEVKDTGTAFDGTETCGSPVAENGSAVTVEASVTSLTEDEYHWRARVKDQDDAVSAWVVYNTSDINTRDFGVDTTAPTAGNVYDGTSAGTDATFNDGSLTELSANWANFNFDISGPHASARYEYSIGTTQGGTDVRDWTSTGTTASVTATGLTLQTSDIYYVNVRAVDVAGNVATLSSDGQFVLPELSFSVSPTNLTFENINADNDYTDTDTTTLTTSTNAYGGYVIRAFAADLLETAGDDFNIPWFSAGSYASPAAWGGSDVGYGYTSNDTTIQGSNKFSSGTLYAPFSTTGPGDIVADHTVNVEGTPVSDEVFTITHRVTTSASQAAGAYNTTIIYTVTAEY